MILSFQRTLAAPIFACVLLAAIACTHRPASGSVPTSAPAPGQQSSLKPDQVNTEGWTKAWTNLVNEAEQSFTPSFPALTAVEVELVVGNPGPAKSELTLTVLDATGQALAAMTEIVSTQGGAQVMFVIPKGGIEVTPGQTYRLKLTGDNTFGWKYIVGGYEKGEATFNGKPLLADARSTFLFRTFGTN